MKKPLVVLASASPRRKEILENHGVRTIVIPSDVEETVPEEVEKEGFAEIVKYLAWLKARAVKDFLLAQPEALSSRMHENNFNENQNEPIFILGADTVVVKDRLIGKPADAAEAFTILSDLRNAEHHVLTGVCIIHFDSGEETIVSADTRVVFKDYPDEEIWRFIREEPPFDKSGSYAIQSSWSKNVALVDGDIENVIGLPYSTVEPYLK